MAIVVGQQPYSYSNRPPLHVTAGQPTTGGKLLSLKEAICQPYVGRVPLHVVAGLPVGARGLLQEAADLEG